jgi:hypothetical protein
MGSVRQKVSYQACFNINGAQPGSMIKLLAGEYHVGYMAIYGFKGSIVGAGRDLALMASSLADQIR